MNHPQRMDCYNGLPLYAVVKSKKTGQAPFFCLKAAIPPFLEAAVYGSLANFHSRIV